MIENKETIMVGDLNFDAKAINKNKNQKTNYKKTFNKMYISVKDWLFSKNMVQMVNKDTRIKSILDHVYLNNIDKIKLIDIIDDRISDHAKIIILRSMNIKKKQKKT